MTLKKYQDRTLAVVKAYFERLQFKSAVEAYDEVTQEGDIRLRLGKEYGYKSPKGLEDAPRCLSEAARRSSRRTRSS